MGKGGQFPSQSVQYSYTLHPPNFTRFGRVGCGLRGLVNRGETRPVCHLCVASKSMAEIQGMHISIGHTSCELLQERLTLP
jgi:hypothetical protein